jgi:hypothetical protein
MKISKVMLAAVFLTAAILAILSGVVSNVLAERNAANQATNSSGEVQQYQEREAQYQQVIQQANQQLEQANTELKTLQQQVTELKKQSAPVENTVSNTTANMVSTALSAEKAGQIAEENAAPGQALQKKPELENFEGKTAYEAVFEKGSVYVDAQSGEVLFNGTVPQKITLAKAAQVASDYLKNKDVLQVDQITFRNAPIYRVIFKDGTMVYMDITGQIFYIQKASPDVVVVQQASAGSAPSAPASAPVTHEHEHEDGGD